MSNLVIVRGQEETEYLERSGVLAANGAHKCTNLDIFTVLDDAMLVTLGPYQAANILLKYQSFEPRSCTYLLKFTKLVDMYDLGTSYQIRVNQEQGKGEREVQRSTAKQLKDQLPPDEIVTLMQDP